MLLPRRARLQFARPRAIPNAGALSCRALLSGFRLHVVQVGVWRMCGPAALLEMAAGMTGKAADAAEAPCSRDWVQLYLLAHDGNYAKLQALLAAGAYVDAMGATGTTALHCAAGRGHVACVGPCWQPGPASTRLTAMAIQRWHGQLREAACPAWRRC